MTSSSEPVGGHRRPGIVSDAGVSALPVPELRSGTWTRFGSPGLLGDAVTERALAGLAETTRNAARTQGYATGWSEGRREAAAGERLRAAEAEMAQAEAEERREAEHRAAVAGLEAAAARLEEATGAACARIEEQASGLALELVRVLLGHEMRVEIAADAVARVLEVLPDGPSVEVRLHPAHAAAAASADLRERGARVVADPDLAAGDAVVEATDHVVDLRLDGALARLDEALGAAAPARPFLSAVSR